MWRSAAIRRPLRSKRAMISPVRLRAKASGFTRMRVLSMCGRVLSGLGGNGRLLRRAGGAAAARGGLADLRLAVRADLPAGIQRLAARGARLLQPAQAARAAEEALLDVEVAVWAGEVIHVRDPCLRGRDLELPLAPVLDVL